MTRFWLVLAFVFWPALASAQTTLADVPYWKLMEGWWRAENTYMDGALDYNIRSYNSLIHVELRGRTYIETEYKFYPPSKLALQNGRGKTTADEGIETVTIAKGELVDESGTLKITEMLPGGARDEITQVLSKDTAVRVTANPNTGVDTYRMFVFAPSPDKRYRSNFGIVSDSTGSGAANAAPDAKLGDLRGFSLFREDRIASGDVKTWQAAFRAKNQVKAVVEPGPDGKANVRRLD